MKTARVLPLSLGSMDASTSRLLVHTLEGYRIALRYLQAADHTKNYLQRPQKKYPLSCDGWLVKLQKCLNETIIINNPNAREFTTAQMAPIAPTNDVKAKIKVPHQITTAIYSQDSEHWFTVAIVINATAFWEYWIQMKSYSQPRHSNSK